MRPSIVVQNDWCVFTEKVWSLLPQRTAQMVLQEIGVVLACDSPMLGQLPNCTPSICLQQCGHLTNLGFCCAGSSGPWLMSHSAVQHGRLEPTLQLSYTVMLPYRKSLPVLGNTLLLFCPCLIQFLTKNTAPVY